MTAEGRCGGRSWSSWTSSSSLSGGLLARLSQKGVTTETQRAALAAYTRILDVEYAGNQRGHALLAASSSAAGLGNSYHNRMHAADVVQATNLLSRPAYGALDDVALLALLFQLPLGLPLLYLAAALTLQSGALLFWQGAPLFFGDDRATTTLRRPAEPRSATDSSSSSSS